MRKHTVLSFVLCLAVTPVACGRSDHRSAADSGTSADIRGRATASSSRGMHKAASTPVASLAIGSSAGGVADASSIAEQANVGTNSLRAASEPAQSSMPLSVQLAQAPPADGAMLIRHGDASVEVRRLDDALPTIRQAATQYGGFVANTAIRSGRDEQRSATLELRVPAPQFDALLSALNAVGKVESVNATAQDVGEEYADAGARVANARRVEARLAELLATRTGRLSDVLTLEQELSRVREQIERYDGRLRYLERHATLSTLSVVLHEPLPLIDRPRNGPIMDALGSAWSNLIAVIAWCIASLGIIVPLALLIALSVLLRRRVLRGGHSMGHGIDRDMGRRGAGVHEA